MADDPGTPARSSGRAAALFQKGEEAALKNNYAYAVDMFTQALKLEPENLQFRNGLRAIERKQFENDPNKVGLMAKSRAKTARMGIGIAKSRGRWPEVIEACEEVFKYHPWDIHAARDAAEAAEHLGWKGLARWMLESVGMVALNDPHYCRHLAHVYELHQDWERAIILWERVRRMAPTDDEAMRKTKDLAANETITRSGLDSSDHRIHKGAAAQPEGPSETELADLKRNAMSPEDRLRKEIEEEPRRVGSYLELAETLRRHNKLDEAQKILAQGLKANPDDSLLEDAHGDVQIARLQRAHASWGKKARESPTDPEARAKLDQIERALAEYELKELRRRSERRPEDISLRIQVGQRLVRQQKYDQAIAEFQQARQSSEPALKVQALHQLGLCFEAKSLPKLAERNYQEALKLVDPDDLALLNALHYRLGRAAEAQGDLKTAEEHYNEVAANDYGYEDVARRLENLNRKAGL